MAHILETLGVSKLRLRGRNNQYNGFDRMFASIEEANLSLGDGDYTPEAGRLNAVLVDSGIFFYSFDLGQFVSAGSLESIAAQADTYLNLDGSNDHVVFDAIAGSNVCRFDAAADPWAVAFTVVRMTTIVDSAYMNIISNGDNKVFLCRGGGNMGIYYSENANQGSGSNTWMAPAAGDKIVIQGTGTGYVQYWVNGVMRAQTNTSAKTDQTGAGTYANQLTIGNGNHFGDFGDFALDNLWIFDGSLLGTTQLAEFFGSAEEPVNMALYADATDVIRMDESDTTITGEKSVYEGDLINGTAALNFLPVPSE